MDVFAYCCASFEQSARQAAGVAPLLSPPTSAVSFDVALLEGRDLLYFDLHGAPGEGCWRGDGGLVALTAGQVAQADLGGALVFAASCYLGDENSPMLDALLDAGAKYVVGGDGQNWGPGRGPLYGAPLLAQWWRRWLMLGMAPLWSLAMAKRAVAFRGTAAEDTLEFRAFHRPDEEGLA